MGGLRTIASVEQWLALAALFVVSAVGLVFEITLTRLFSLYFQYHFTFLAVSLAILGLSLGAASAHYLTTTRRQAASTLTLVLIALSTALTLGSLIIALLPSADSIFPRALTALVIFFLLGLFDALLFENFAAQSGSFYAADLVGAAVGVAAVLALLYVTSAFSIVLLLAVIVGGVALTFAYSIGGRASRPFLIAAASTLAGIILLIANVTTGMVDFNPTGLSGAPRDKTMISILQDGNQNGNIIYTGWSPFARVDVVQTNDPASRYIFADGGAGAYMMAYDGNLNSLDSMSQTVEYLPFVGGGADNTLIIGAGGGKDILLALRAKAQNVTAIEVNPAIITATRHFADYNGNVLDLPQVHLTEGDARSFVERSDAQYDLIYLNLVYTQAVEPASQALIENYIFTEEAFQTYLNHLTPNGRLAVISHNALEGSRASLTALKAMEVMGTTARAGLDRLWLWMYPATDTTVRTSVLIVGKNNLATTTLQELNTTAQEHGMQPLFIPGAYESLFELLRKGEDVATFVKADAQYNLGPTTDDQPYFFNLDYGVPPAIRSALIMSALLAVGLLALAYGTVLANVQNATVGSWQSIAYALLIGMGFMLVEIPLIQRFQILLGQPILSLAVVLATLLLSGGLGSRMSQRWPTAHLPAYIRVVGLWIAVTVVIYWVALPSLVNAILPMPTVVRLLVMVVLTALLGFPMGIPFPSLMRMGGEGRPQIAYLWAINGAFSVLGSTLAMAISMEWGFKWALIAGALCYVLLAVVAWLILRGSKAIQA